MNFSYQSAPQGYYPTFFISCAEMNAYNQIQPQFNPFALNFSNAVKCHQSKEKTLNQVQIQANLTIIDDIESSEKKVKLSKNEKKKYERNRNLSSLILKQFIKDIINDPSVVFEVLKLKKSSYLVKNFLQKIKEIFPQHLTYIRPLTLRRLCLSKEDKEFSEILRKVLFYYLKKEYPRLSVYRKKKKYSHLR